MGVLGSEPTQVSFLCLPLYYFMLDSQSSLLLRKPRDKFIGAIQLVQVNCLGYIPLDWICSWESQIQWFLF